VVYFGVVVLDGARVPVSGEIICQGLSPRRDL
jgi:hypothetical protein